MSVTRPMKALLAELAHEAGQKLERPAEPSAVMQALCDVMSRRQDRPVRLQFRRFPVDTASGLRIDFGTNTLIVIEERATPEHQLVILGHELWHEHAADCSHSVDGAAVAARMLSLEEVDWDALLAVAARSDFDEEHEADAETFGLLVGRQFRSWITGPHARGPVTKNTVVGRLRTSLDYHGLN